MKYVLIVFVVLLSACTVKPSESDASEYVENLRYVKAKNGVCYAVANTFNTAGNTNVILSYVPCEKAGLAPQM